MFLLDYHDLFLPYVHKIRELEDVTFYGSRTLFFLTKSGTLRPLAIELTRPASPTKPQWKQVFKHSSSNATESWLWKLAKAHVLSHDSGYHQLVSHWYVLSHIYTFPPYHQRSCILGISKSDTIYLYLPIFKTSPPKIWDKGFVFIVLL